MDKDNLDAAVWWSWTASSTAVSPSEVLLCLRCKRRRPPGLSPFATTRFTGGKGFAFTVADLRAGVLHYHHEDSDTTKD